jgi:iron complex transport system ATP-binding protein
MLLLDEPGGGLDFEGRETLLAALARVAEDPELISVTTTHHVEELPRSTTHALLLAGGRVVASGDADETLTAEQLSACFGLPIRVARANGRWSATAA